MGMIVGSGERDNYPVFTRPATEEWVQIAAVFINDGDHSFYYNGNKAPITITGKDNPGLDHLFIGGNKKFSDTFSNTWIKEVKVFDKALDENEVQALYGNHLSSFQAVRNVLVLIFSLASVQTTITTKMITSTYFTCAVPDPTCTYRQ